MARLQAKQILPGSANQVISTVAGKAAWSSVIGGQGERFAAFGDGSDGDLSLVGNTTLALQGDSIVKHYNNLSLNGFELRIPQGQSMAVIHVNGTLDLGTGGKIVHLGDPYQYLNIGATGLWAAAATVSPVDPVRIGGAGGPPGGCLYVFARSIVGSGQILADGLAGDPGQFDDTTFPNGDFGGVGGNAIAAQNTNLFGTNILAFSGATQPAAGVYNNSSAATNPGGTPPTDALWGDGSPTFDRYSLYYLDPHCLLNTFGMISFGMNSTELFGPIPQFFRGLGGYGGAAGSSVFTDFGTPFAVVSGAGGGAGGSMLRGRQGGNGGDGGAVSGGAISGSGVDFYGAATGGGAGGGGAGGFVVVRCAQNSTTSLLVGARGGAGGAAPGIGGTKTEGLGGGAAAAGGAGGGGGGGGGIAVYQGPDQAGTSVSAAGGAGGAGGAGAAIGGASASPGTAGAAGATGLAFDCSY